VDFYHRLVQRLLPAKRELRLPQEIAKLQQAACLILDDLGYVQQDREEMEVLFTLLAERYEQRSHYHQPGVLGLGSHLQRSHDHPGSCGQRCLPFRHSLYEQCGELSGDASPAGAQQ
jgi:hypothetical protein